MREAAPTVLAETGSAEQAAKAAGLLRRIALGTVPDHELGPGGTEAPVSH